MAKTTAMIVILAFAASSAMTTIPVNAQTTIPPVIQLPAGATPAVTIDTIAYMSYRPNPVGVGQAVLFNLWLEPPTNYARYLTGFTVTFTRPDGTKDTFGPMTTYQGDSTAWFEYVVDQTGTWKLNSTSQATIGQQEPFLRDSCKVDHSTLTQLTTNPHNRRIRTDCPKRPSTSMASLPASNRLLDKTSLAREQRMDTYLRRLPMDRLPSGTARRNQPSCKQLQIHAFCPSAKLRTRCMEATGCIIRADGRPIWHQTLWLR